MRLWLKKSLFGFLLIALVNFLILPKISWAFNFENLDKKEIERYLEFPEKDTKELLSSLIDILSNEWVLSWGYVTPEEEVVPLILRKAVRIDALRYLLLDAPIGITAGIVKNGVKMARLFYAMDVSAVLGEIERITVKKAVQYGVNFLLQNEVRITPGALSIGYKTKRNVIQKAIFQYILIFKPLNNKQGEVGIEIYSPKPLGPPASEGSIGSAFGTPNVLEKDLPPFIVTIQGKVEKLKYGDFSWVASPKIEISFPEEVPDLGFRPLSFWQRHLWKPLKTKIKETNVVLERILVKPTRTITKTIGKNVKSFFNHTAKRLKKATKTVVDKIDSYLLKVDPGAWIVREVGDANVPRSDLGRFEESIARLTEEALSLDRPKQQDLEVAEEIAVLEQDSSEQQPSLEELIEKFDEISEEIEMVLAQTEELLPEANLQEDENLKVESGMAEQTSKEEAAKETEIEIVLASEESEETPGVSKVSEGEDEGEIIFCAVPGGQSPAQNKVIFNEIAWMGTVNSANDEWIELKNISGNSVDLTGWQILDKDEQIKIVFGNFTLAPNAFFLLERTDDDSAPGISADFIYTGALNNNNETLYLFDKNCTLQDKVAATPDWPAGDNSSKKTMERKTNLAWQTSRSSGGTAKAENSSGEPFYYTGGGGGAAATAAAATVSPSPAESSPEPTTPLKILITEIQIKDATSSDHDFIELFNPNSEEVDISGFQLKKRSSTGKEYSVRVLPENSTIQAQGYFLWANTEYARSNQVSANTTSTQTLAKDNSLALFNKEGNILDQVAWGTSANPFVETTPFLQNPEAGQTLSRKWSSTTREYLDTDNNQHDFKLQTPTPGEKNQPLEEEEGAEQGKEQATTTPPIAQSVIISEIQIQNKEFVEIFNPTNKTVSTSEWYLVYFSADKNWTEPYRSWAFSATSTIAANSYYLVGIYGFPEQNGNPNPDWVVLTQAGRPYSQGQLSNQSGAVGIFSCDPSTASTTEIAQNCKIDLVSWGNPQVKEATSTLAHDNGKSLTRKQDQNNNFIDANNNSTDFEIKNPSPTNSKGEKGNIFPPEPVENFQVATSTNNMVVLSWSTTTDPDSPQEDISYFIYYSKQGEVTPDTLASTTTATATATTTTITLNDLYYDATYYFGIRAFDGLNYSTLSTTSPLAIPLPKIFDLTAGPASQRKSIALFWTSSATTYFVPGQGLQTAQPTSYEIRYSDKEIVEAAAGENQTLWTDAALVANSISPQGEGEIETLVVSNLTPNQTYYFAVKSIGENSTVSKISNLARAKALPGFQDNGDGTITDLAFGLSWVKDGASTPSYNGATSTQNQAIAFVNNLNFAGYDDWRLPNFKELASMLNYGQEDATLNQGFVNIRPNRYWTSTKIRVSALPRYKAFYLDFANGEALPVWYNGEESPGYYLLPVRGRAIPGGFSGDEFDFEDNGDSTVTDKRTGLMWANATSAQTFASGIGEYIYDNRKTWQKAIRFANNRVLCQDGTFQGDENEPGDCSGKGGVKYDDWRLPNIQEIAGITKMGGSLVLPNKSGDSWYYWSSSLAGNDKAWMAGNNNYLGKISATKKTSALNVQIVRDNF